MPTAILVDGGYFVKRYRKLKSSVADRKPEKVAENLFSWALKHLESRDQPRRELYRIFFYDCPPLDKKAHNPVTQKAIDFSRTAEAIFRRGLHEELRKKRKLALRLGRLDASGHWTLHPRQTKAS